MVTRVFIFQTKPGLEEELTRWWRQAALPVLRTQKGFVNIRMLKSTERPDTYSFITDWQSKADIEAYLNADRDSSNVFRQMLSQRLSSEVFETIGQA